MAKVGVKLGYTKKVGDFDFLRADITIDEIDTEQPLDIQLGTAEDYLLKILAMAKENINAQYKQQKKDAE
tara:strand:+ start:4492 stop:4701 length:210 start_codon:yes stop_codon:yes gene_type:complete